MADESPAGIKLLPTHRIAAKAQMLVMLKDWTERVERDEVAALAVVGVDYGTTHHTHTYAAYDKVALVSALEILKVQICNQLLR